MNFYSIRHLTRFRYAQAVSESILETRMHPRSDSSQHCLAFTLSVSPRCRVFSYRDHLGNNVQHFDIPGEHGQLVIIAESLVEQQKQPTAPSSFAPYAWEELDALIREGDYWEMLLPSTFAEPTEALKGLAAHLGIQPRNEGERLAQDPMTLVRALNQALYQYFDYVPRATRVDSPIDEAIISKRGVCQDFAHTMIALLRYARIPARYVSGYLYRATGSGDRSTPDATHAWVEALMPHVGWVGFDPTNNLIAHQRHIRAAVGRDYADVPPTRGIFRGRSDSELFVAVKVEASDEPPALDRKLPIPEDWSVLVETAQQQPVREPDPYLLQQQQQQQQ